MGNPCFMAETMHSEAMSISGSKSGGVRPLNCRFSNSGSFARSASLNLPAMIRAWSGVYPSSKAARDIAAATGRSTMRAASDTYQPPGSAWPGRAGPRQKRQRSVRRSVRRSIPPLASTPVKHSRRPPLRHKDCRAGTSAAKDFAASG